MCGIAGILQLDGTNVAHEPLEAMTARIAHRGPDGRGVHFDGPVGLGHVRLSIIDVATGAQPMSSGDGALWITFNGEIFNYVELREELKRTGYTFRTTSDTEVILALYDRLGEDCVRELNGDFAFAIWDTRRRRLFMARDRFGVRPLFYATQGKTFLFASECKAILGHPGFPRRLDPIGIDQAFTFWFPVAPRTAFGDISQLPPGHTLTVDLDAGGPPVTRPYFSIDYAPEGGGPHAAERLLELLTDATRIRLRADVPVGSYLSGGLDSSLITALARRVAQGPLDTFSVTFNSPEFDESSFQDEVVRYLGITRHHARACRDVELSAAFPQVVWHAEQPLMRTAPAPLFLLSALVRELGYKVVLTGEGADELFGGYDIFKEAKVRRFWARFPDSKQRPLLLKRLYPYMSNLQSQPLEYLKAFFHVRSEDVHDRAFSHLPRWRLTAKTKQFFGPALREPTQGLDAVAALTANLPSRFDSWDDLAQAQFLETAYLLPGYILSCQSDRMAMAHGVEGRFPFLDHRVFEFAARLKPEEKIKVLNEKHLLKAAARDAVPPFLQRRPKQPYRAADVPSFVDATRGTVHHAYVDEALSESALKRSGLFEPAAVALLLRKAKTHPNMSAKDSMAFVGILSTQLLFEQFIEGRTVDGR